MINFKCASHYAINEVFLRATIQGCYFHLGSAFCGKVQASGLTKMYNKNSRFRKLIDAID